MLGRVHTVIVDEVHTLARDKRGSHLALSLERLAHVVGEQGGACSASGSPPHSGPSRWWPAS